MTDAATVRAALLRNGFTTEGVLTVLGADAFAALGRGELVPARHSLAEQPDGPLTDLLRLFLLGEEVPSERLGEALPLAAAAELGLVARNEDGSRSQVRARVHLHPYPTTTGQAYIASDFRSAQDEPGSGKRSLAVEHVVGVGGASVTLATITPRSAVGSTLDLGTGCGVQGLLAAEHSQRVVATDRSTRALRMAGLTAALSDVALDLRAGSLFEPVESERFDLIVANPPFVISPHARYSYRESPLRADDLSRAVVRGAAEHLSAGGTAIVLASWLHTSDESWHDRLASWAPDDCQVWVAQREHLSPPEYVELWLRDSQERCEPDYEDRYSQWLNHLDDLGAIGVGFGWIVMRRGERPWFVAEDVAEAERLPTGDEVEDQMRHYTALQDANAVRLLAAEPRWSGLAELHRSWRPADGEAEIFASAAWRPVVPVSQDVVAVIDGVGTLADRIQNNVGSDDAAVEDLTAEALVCLRRLIGAGVVTIDD